jgi:hypothetical protein
MDSKSRDENRGDSKIIDYVSEGNCNLVKFNNGEIELKYDVNSLLIPGNPHNCINKQLLTVARLRYRYCNAKLSFVLVFLDVCDLPSMLLRRIDRPQAVHLY